jgi:hypothetical protein
MGQYLVLFAIAFVPYVLTVLLGAGWVGWKWRKRAEWQRWEIGGAVLPYIFWMALFTRDDSKSLVNLFREPIYLGAVIVIVAWCRVAVAPVIQPKRAALWGTVASTAAAWVIWLWVPWYPH